MTMWQSKAIRRRETFFAPQSCFFMRPWRTLRGLILLKLPYGPAKLVADFFGDKRIPIGDREDGNADQSVLEFLTAEIKAKLDDSKTFSDVGAVVRAVSQLGIQGSIKGHESLGKMMARRHDIVHRCDRKPADGATQGPPQTITKTQVEEWRHVVFAFADSLIKRCCLC